MQSICSWCGAQLGEGTIDPDRPLSHGICKPCISTYFGDVGTPLADFLAGLDIPVLLVDGNLVVRGGSPLAPEMTGKATEGILGQLGGDVFECANAALPEGCGRTIHCSGCVVRRTVTETYRTGRSQTRVPATLKVGQGAAREDVALYVTTEKVAHHVLLRIEPA